MLVTCLLGMVFVLRAWGTDQPILENYVGRQVPTAMVARNLIRGSGFLSPQLDTGPFPNLFLVEPPIHAAVAGWLCGVLGIPLDASGRLVSAAATTLAAWGLFGLMRRRRGQAAAVATVIVFAAFPVTIRYGRAFQPDALAMGLVVAGMRCWHGSGRLRACVGGTLMALGLAQKITWGLILIPLIFESLKETPRSFRIAALMVVLPTLSWYVHAVMDLSVPSPGSAASVDNASNWLARLTGSHLLERQRILAVARDLFIRSFTPIGVALVLFGLGWRREIDRLWSLWLLAGVATLLVLFGKLHHDYYWLILSPPMAAWAGIGLAEVSRRSRFACAALFVSMVVLGAIQSRSTWRTPREWCDAGELAASVRCYVPTGDLVIAPEAIIHLGDRRGCRLEWEAGSVRRAANEWRPVPAFTEDDPAALVAFYRKVSGARFFADLDASPLEPARDRLHEAIRHDPSARILDDRPGRYLLVEFIRSD